MTLPDDVLAQVARAIGTPACIYDAARLRDGVAQLRRELPGVDFFYSLKANPNLSIVQLLAGQDIGAEVCSLFGIETCLAAGVRPERMIVVGPSKSDEDRAGRRQRIGLRINPAFHIPGACLAMGGKPTQFGIDEAELAAAIADVAGDRRPPTCPPPSATCPPARFLAMLLLPCGSMAGTQVRKPPTSCCAAILRFTLALTRQVPKFRPSSARKSG